MIYTIESEYGKVEIDKEKRSVYFYKDDFEYTLDKDNEFKDYYGGEWRVIWNKNRAILEIKYWKEMGRA